MPSNLLPVGSVVRLEGTGALVMVLGFVPQLDDGQADYLGTPYPQGLVSEDAALAFDANAVAEVVHQGYWDVEGDAALAAVRRYRDAADELATQFEAFVQTLTPERIVELHAEHVLNELFDQMEDEPEPDLFDDMDEEPEPDFPDEGDFA